MRRSEASRREGIGRDCGYLGKLGASRGIGGVVEVGGVYLDLNYLLDGRADDFLFLLVPEALCKEAVSCDERSKERSEERSDEWKVISFVSRRYVQGRSDELEVFVEEGRYGMLFILSPRFSVLLSFRSSLVM